MHQCNIHSLFSLNVPEFFILPHINYLTIKYVLDWQFYFQTKQVKGINIVFSGIWKIIQYIITMLDPLWSAIYSNSLLVSILLILFVTLRDCLASSCITIFYCHIILERFVLWVLIIFLRSWTPDLTYLLPVRLDLILDVWLHARRAINYQNRLTVTC